MPTLPFVINRSQVLKFGPWFLPVEVQGIMAGRGGRD